MIAAAPTTHDRPVVCVACGADRMGCELKSHYSGRPCCRACEGPQSHNGDADAQHDKEEVE